MLILRSLNNFLNEFKNFSTLNFLNFLITVCVVFTKKKIVFAWLICLVTALENNFIEPEFNFVIGNVTEIFNAYVLLIIFISTHVVIILLNYTLLKLLSSVLNWREKKLISIVFVIVVINSVFFTIIFHLIVFKYSWSFFSSFFETSYLESKTIYFEIRVNEYVNFYVKTYNLMLINFYFLLVFLFSTYFFLENLKTRRKYFWSFFVILSTLVTPPDLFSQIAFGFLLVLIYELNYFYVKFLKKIKIKREAS